MADQTKNPDGSTVTPKHPSTVPPVSASTPVAPAAEIASSILSANYALTTAQADVPGWQIVVPAGSGPHEVGVPEGILTNIVTGTSAIAQLIQNEFWILDEGNVVIAYAKFSVMQVTAVTKNVGGNVPLGRGGLPNPVTDKTYRVQAKQGLQGTLGVAGNIFTAASGFMNPTLRAVRR
jgi:hypothetical protein